MVPERGKAGFLPNRMDRRNKWLAGLGLGAVGGVLLAALAIRKCRQCGKCGKCGEEPMQETEVSCPAVQEEGKKSCRLIPAVHAAAAVISGMNLCFLLKRIRGKR